MRFFPFLAISLTLWLVVFDIEAVRGDEASPTYWKDVRAVLRRHCTVCHNGRNLDEVEVSGGFRMDSYQAVIKNPKKKLLTPRKSDISLLIQVMTTNDTTRRMPLGAKPVPPEQIALLRRWIDTGAREGTRPKLTPETVIRRPARRRKLNIFLPTTLTPPTHVFGKLPRAPLQLVLRVGPLAPVTAVAFSPDGRWLASGSYRRATVWDLGTGKPTKVFTNLLAAVNDVQFSPDGKLLAVAGGQPSARGDLRLFQLPEGKLKALLGGHEDVVGSVDFHPKGTHLASASFDKTLRIWNLASWKTEQIFKGHSDFVRAVSYAPDGQRLSTASKDQTVRVIDANTGKSQLTFSGMTQPVLSVAFHPDGKHVVSSGHDARLSWWDTTTGKRTRFQGGHGVAVHELNFTRDGKYLVSAGGDSTVRVWDGRTGRLLRTIRVGSLVYAVAVSPDGKRLAAGSFDGLVRLYEVSTGAHVLTLMSLGLEKEKEGWLVQTPTGYTIGSPGVQAAGSWRMGTRSVSDPVAWKGLDRPHAIAETLQGKKVPPPTFSK